MNIVRFADIHRMSNNYNLKTSVWVLLAVDSPAIRSKSAAGGVLVPIDRQRTSFTGFPLLSGLSTKVK